MPCLQRNVSSFNFALLCNFLSRVRFESVESMIFTHSANSYFTFLTLPCRCFSQENIIYFKRVALCYVSHLLSTTSLILPQEISNYHRKYLFLNVQPPHLTLQGQSCENAQKKQKNEKKKKNKDKLA